MDISKLSVPELKDLLGQIPAEIKRREKQQKKSLLEQFAELAAKEGLSLNEVIGGEVEQKEKKTIPVKYRNPTDTNLAWTGRGRQPKWIQQHLANGGKLEDLAI